MLHYAAARQLDDNGCWRLECATRGELPVDVRINRVRHLAHNDVRRVHLNQLARLDDLTCGRRVARYTRSQRAREHALYDPADTIAERTQASALPARELAAAIARQIATWRFPRG